MRILQSTQVVFVVVRLWMTGYGPIYITKALVYLLRILSPSFIPPQTPPHCANLCVIHWIGLKMGCDKSSQSNSDRMCIRVLVQAIPKMYLPILGNIFCNESSTFYTRTHTSGLLIHNVPPTSALIDFPGLAKATFLGRTPFNRFWALQWSKKTSKV